MYRKFYGLTADPFRLSPDHAFCLPHRSFAKAKAYMRYAMHRGEGFVMITGAPGTGKTTLIDELMADARPGRYRMARLQSVQVEADDVLRLVATAFGLQLEQSDKSTILQRLTERFDADFRQGRRSLLIIDEAQGLGLSALEELRLLTNSRAGGQPLLQIFLVGQEELRDMVTSPQLEQLNQRMIAAYHMEPLKPDEFVAYVLHRLTKAGWQGNPALEPDLFAPVFRVSNGVPRRINHICSRLLLHGFLEEKTRLDSDNVAVVIKELRAEHYALEERSTLLSQDSFNADDLRKSAAAALQGRERQPQGPKPAAREVSVASEPPESVQDDCPAAEGALHAATQTENKGASDSTQQVIPLLTRRVPRPKEESCKPDLQPLDLASDPGPRHLFIVGALATSLLMLLVLVVSVLPIQHLERVAAQSVWQTLGVIQVRDQITHWSGGRLPLKQTGVIGSQPTLLDQIDRPKKSAPKRVAVQL